MLMADDSNPTDFVFYTWNEFYSTGGCTFTDGGPIEVTNIVVNPTNVVQEFILHGYRVVDSQNQGVIIHFDFTNMQERQCVDSDYELWSPSDSSNQTGSNCLLGETIAYKRRKRLAECFNGDLKESENFTKICPCTREDYECDYCFEENGLFCEKINDCTPDPPPCINGYYQLSSGYRLVPGTICNLDTGLNLFLSPFPCGLNETTSSSTSSPVETAPRHTPAGLAVLIAFLVLGATGALLGALWFLNKKKNFVNFKSFRPLPLSSIYNNQESTALDEDLLEKKPRDEAEE